MPPPCGAGAYGYWPATPRNEASGGLFACCAADLLVHRRRLARGMRGLAGFAAEGLMPEHRLDSCMPTRHR